MPILIPWIVVGIEAIVGWFVLFGARKSWLYFTGAIGRFIHKPTSFFRSIWDWTVLGQLTKGLEAVHKGEDQLGKGAQETEPTAAGWVAGLAAGLEYHAFTTKYLAAGVLDSLHAIRAHAIPRGVRAGTASARAQSEAASRRARAAARGAAAAEAGALSAGRVATRAGARATHAEHTAAVAAGATAIPHPWDRPAARAREEASAAERAIARWLRRGAAGLLAAVGAGVILRVIVRHLPWYRCSNVDRAARGLCRMDRGLLDALLAGTVLLAGSISFREFTRECQRFEPVLEGGLRRLIRELHDLES